jgi:hypothetical protein
MPLISCIHQVDDDEIDFSPGPAWRRRSRAACFQNPVTEPSRSIALRSRRLRSTSRYDHHRGGVRRVLEHPLPERDMGLGPQ